MGHHVHTYLERYVHLCRNRLIPGQYVPFKCPI